VRASASACLEAEASSGVRASESIGRAGGRLAKGGESACNRELLLWQRGELGLCGASQRPAVPQHC